LAALMAVLFAVYQSYKMYVGRVEQTQPRAMAMASGR
jgi:Tfp pilus assembly protein PilE